MSGCEFQRIESAPRSSHVHMQNMAKQMDRARKTKIALLAAASVFAGAAAAAPAHAIGDDPMAQPTVIEAAAISTDHAGDAADQRQSPAAAKWALLGAAAGVLAGLVKLVGARKIARVAGATASRAAKVSVEAVAGAARVTGRVFAKPARFFGLMAGLALFSLTGLWLFDLEWLGGLLAGAALAGGVFLSAAKMRNFFARPNPLKSQNNNMVN